MKIKWIGKYKEVERVEEVPAHYHLFIDNSYDTLKIVLGIVLLFLQGFLAFRLKQSLHGVHFSREGYFGGFGLAILFLVVHEFIHAWVLLRWTNVKMGWVPAGLFTLPESAITRRQYLLTLLAPSLLLGFFPLLMWILIPIESRHLSTVLFVFSLGSLGASIADFSNFFITLQKVPKQAFVKVLNMRAYWYLQAEMTDV